MSVRLLGRLLRPLRAGEQKTVWHHPAVCRAPDALVLTSPMFVPDGVMPRRCAGPGVGENVSPGLIWAAAPLGTVELVLIVEDPDVPLRRPVVHLVALGLPPQATAVPDGYFNEASGSGVRLGIGSFGKIGWQGPRPVPGHGAHRYVFQMLALNRSTSGLDRPTLGTLLEWLDGAVIARGRLAGIYER